MIGMTGDVVGSYRVTRKLGSGGMGEVWAAEHVLLGNKVAIKFLLPEVTKHEGIVKRFFDEARAATQIADPGIVAVYDFGWQDNRAYIIMEHLTGEPLSKRLKARRTPLEQALRIAQQVSLTMSVAHGRGIIHRDLKPDNIFLVADAAMPGGERAKILDFGIAKLIVEDGSASNTRTDVVMGTPTYMSPEQCRGTAGVDHRTDIYALGCVLYELVCDRLPFVQPTTSDMIASHLLEKPPAPSSIDPSIPASVDEILLRCLAKDPAERFQTMTDLARALAAAAGFPLDVATIPPVRPSRRRTPLASEVTNSPTTLGHSAAESLVQPARRRGTWIALGAAVLLAGTTMTIILASRDGSPPVPGTSLPIAPAQDAAFAASPRDPIASPAIVPDAGALGVDAAVARPDAPVPNHTPHGPKASGVKDLYDNR